MEMFFSGMTKLLLDEDIVAILLFEVEDAETELEDCNNELEETTLELEDCLTELELCFVELDKISRELDDNFAELEDSASELISSKLSIGRVTSESEQAINNITSVNKALRTIVFFNDFIFITVRI
jgi:chromosome segregation ATPase